MVTVAGGYTQDIFSMWIKVIWGIQQWFISGHRNMSCRESQFFVIPFWSHTQIYSWIYVIPSLGHVRSCSNSHWDPRHKLCRVPFFPNIFQAVTWFENVWNVENFQVGYYGNSGMLRWSVRDGGKPCYSASNRRYRRMVWERSWACKVAVFERQLISIGGTHSLKCLW